VRHDLSCDPAFFEPGGEKRLVVTGGVQGLVATLIVRDEARCIVRCLESVRPWVDYMVVLDTGSRDGTPDLARQCGAQVHHMDWPDDFSVARNHLLDLANADWALMIDADEWIASGGEGLRAWCAGPPRLGAACIESMFDQPNGAAPGAPLPSGRNWIVRLLPRGVRYEGRIHEQPMSRLPRHRLSLRIGHDGYLEAQSAGKRARNLALLMRDLEESPDDPYLLYQLGTEAERRGDHAGASDWYDRALQHTPADANWRHALLVRQLHCMSRSGQLSGALALAEQEIGAWQDSPESFFVLGNLLLDQAVAEPGQALGQWLPLARSAWERCLEIGERPDLEGSVYGRGSHLAQHNLDMMRAQMAMLAG